MSAGKRMLQGSALNLADQFLRFFAGFIMAPIIVSSLGETRYGFWILLMSVLGNYSLLDFGLSFSLSKFFAEAIGKGDKPRLRRLVSTAMALFLKIGGIGIALCALAYFLVPVLVTNAESQKSAQWIVLIYGIFLSLGFPVRVFQSFLKSQLRYDLIVLASAVQVVVANVLIYFYLKGGYGIVAMAVINACAGILGYTILTGAGFYRLKGIAIRRRYIDPLLQSELLRYSRVAFLTSIGTGLRSRVDPVVLGIFGMFTGITAYSIGTRFPIYITDLVGAVMGGQILAFLSQLYGRSGHDATVERFLTAIRISTATAVFFGSALIVYGDVFILRWMGEGFGTSAKVMAILAVPYILQLMQYPTLSMLYTLSKHRYIAVTMICGGVANLMMSLIFVYFFGFFGVIWATVIEMSIVYSIIFPMVVIRGVGVPAMVFYRDALGIPLLKTVAVLAPFYVVAYYLKAPDYLRLAGLGVAQAVYFVPVAFFLVLNKSERYLFWNALPWKTVAKENGDRGGGN